MSKSIPTPHDVRRYVTRNFAGELQAWIRSLEQDAKVLHLRGNHLFAAHVTEMQKRAQHLLDCLDLN